MAEFFIFIAYVLGTYMGFVFAKTRVQKIIGETIDNLISQGYLQTKSDDDGEVEIMKWNEK